MAYVTIPETVWREASAARCKGFQLMRRLVGFVLLIVGIGKSLCKRRSRMVVILIKMGVMNKINYRKRMLCSHHKIKEVRETISSIMMS